jgi:hypothetical protein
MAKAQWLAKQRVPYLEAAVGRARELKRQANENTIVAAARVAASAVTQSDKSDGGDGGESDSDEDDEDDEKALTRELARARRKLRLLTTRPKKHALEASGGAGGGSDNGFGDHCDDKEEEEEEEEEDPLSSSSSDEDDEDEDEDELVERHPIDKRVLFSRLPECLVFHVSRQGFDQNTGQMRKIRRHVVFPLGGGAGAGYGAGRLDRPLDMSPYASFGGGGWRGAAAAQTTTTSATTTSTSAAATSRPASRGGEEKGDFEHLLLYDLNAVVVHHGDGCDGVTGHYTCYRRLQAAAAAPPSPPSSHSSRKTARWVHVNDASCREVEASEVAACEAYLLFYCRRKS